MDAIAESVIISPPPLDANGPRWLQTEVRQLVVDETWPI
jgi:hypothetical protein